MCITTQKLVNRVHEYGGRFLKKGKDGRWHNMCAEDTRNKCSQGRLFCYVASLYLTIVIFLQCTHILSSGLRENKWIHIYLMLCIYPVYVDLFKTVLH